MPNLKPPVRSVAEAVAYRDRLRAVFQGRLVMLNRGDR